MTTAAKKRIPSFTTTTDVTIDIDPADLHESGWHHQDECDEHATVDEPEPEPLPGLDLSMRDVIDSLHRQAHPSQHPSPAMCREEPCRSLTLGQLREVS